MALRLLPQANSPSLLDIVPKVPNNKVVHAVLSLVGCTRIP